ncbi:MAG: tetratricopeptide repeat protein [Fimbriimonadaceae bacterium]|jgi:tetratricopeptide (TPR) repeat protein|nr:tetratricopeptide repeat protein [Fimbriimonadaceae bacterium]
MRVAVLPFNSAAGTRPAVARQYANFACEIARGAVEGVEIDTVNYLARVDEQGITRLAMVNPSETLNDEEMLKQIFEAAPESTVIDGLLSETESGGTLTVRVFEPGNVTPSRQEEFSFLAGAEFVALRQLIELVVHTAGGTLSDDQKEDLDLFGTASSKAFVAFLEGFDATQYIDKSQGQVISQFDPKQPMDRLLEAVDLDPDWEGPFLSLLNLCRQCTAYRIGTASQIEASLLALAERAPEDARAWFALGDLRQATGQWELAAESFEKAHKFEPEEPAILTRLAMAQLNMAMPANAERNLRRAVEMEGDDKPSLDLLSQVLTQTGRGHEVPGLWKELIEANPQNGLGHGKYAMALLNDGKKDEALKAFDHALETVEENTIVKRFYAPVLAQDGDFDRAMDFYEDCLESAPGDVGLQLEYAQTLQAAGRTFEIPPVLRQVLESNPDQNTRAQVDAWLTEIEQPKRVETVASAQKAAEGGDFEGAVRQLKPMKNWLKNYWKLYAVLAGALNQLGQFGEAEEAARNLLEMYPGCEPGYAELNNALAGQEKHEEAYQLMQIALNNMPNSLPIALSYAFAAKRVGQGEEALQMAKQIREATNNAAELRPILEELEK